MALVKSYKGLYPDDHPLAGRPHFHFESDNDTPLAYVGPTIFGQVATSDGTVYDVNEDYVEAPLEHHGEISHAIGVRYEAEGHPNHAADKPFVHECSDHCGGLKRKGK